MRRPSIKASLVGIFIAIVTFFGIGAGVTLYGTRDLYHATEDLTDNWVPSVAVASRMETNFLLLRLAVTKHVLSTTPETMAAQEAEFARATNAISDGLKKYEPLIYSPRERELWTDIGTHLTKYVATAQPVLELSRANKNAEAADLFNTSLTPIGKAMMGDADELVEINLKGAHTAGKTADTVYESVMFIALTASALIVLAVVGSIVFVLTGIANPIGRITGAMKSLAAGDTDSQVPFAGRADELGAMAAAVEVFRQAALTNKRLEQDAENARRQAELDRVATQERAEADAAERLRIATSGLAAGLKRLASGDLAFQLTEAFAPDFEQLRHDFNASVKQLGDTLTAISISISTMDNGTREISSGAQDLSKRTEQQAASLEETAAALDQITANVTSSTKRTEEARSVATTATKSAAESAQVVAHAEEAMGRIEASSQQISNIIGVIDEIAFQTNLLALNAGVEAARAGEAGKGFAVVAQEVRELAQRSAQAAKEIKGLIQNSSKEVDSGVKLVRDTGAALKTIGELITEINGHMESIATSAREQSTGLAEVNTAVNSMDQSTQQNAAMVEESTAASASLATEAERLRDLVGQFRLENVQANPAAALRQTARTMAQPAMQRNVAPARAAARPAVSRSSAATAAAAEASWEEF